jgi:putative peptidoglycan lipid II flippase
VRTAPRLLLGAAGGIALVTVASRAVGAVRVAVLSRTLGTSCVGDVYTAANAVPNVVFELVAGGALAALVVPVLAGPVAAGDRATASRTASALLTWTVVVLVPVAVAGVLAAPLIVRALLGDGPGCERAVEVGARMLVVFLPQVVLYGIAVVLTGVLQVHGRFLGPALAPLLSSLVVSSAYLVYAAGGRAQDLSELSRRQELVLSVGTTIGVALLTLSLLMPLRACGLRLRPAWSFPPGVAARARRLAAGGVAGLAAQQLALVVALRLAARGQEGSVVVLTVATALFLLPWGVLAVPVATSVFPSLAAAAEHGDDAAYARALSGAVRSVLLAMAGSAAVLAVAAPAAAEVLVQGAPGAARSADLAAACAAFAPGLVGYGLLALLARACYARGQARTAAAATVTAWLVVAVADVGLVAALPDADRVVLLGAGHTVGLTVGGLVLVAALRGTKLPGAGRSTTAGLAGAASALVLGRLTALALPDGVPALLEAPAVGAAAAAGFLACARVLDPVGLRGLRRA